MIASVRPFTSTVNSSIRTSAAVHEQWNASVQAKRAMMRDTCKNIWLSVAITARLQQLRRATSLRPATVLARLHGKESRAGKEKTGSSANWQGHTNRCAHATGTADRT